MLRRLNAVPDRYMSSSNYSDHVINGSAFSELTGRDDFTLGTLTLDSLEVSRAIYASSPHRYLQSKSIDVDATQSDDALRTQDSYFEEVCCKGLFLSATVAPSPICHRDIDPGVELGAFLGGTLVGEQMTSTSECASVC